MPLRVQLLSAEHALEGMTTKIIRPPPLLRGVEALSLRRNLTALSAAQVLAHEYTHAWLWLQGFPIMEARLEEGLCELLSYLFLLSLREPTAGCVLSPDTEALRRQILSIEANAHPDYGGGFRDCVDALRGRTLHELLSHVREHARLPDPYPLDGDLDHGDLDQDHQDHHDHDEGSGSPDTASPSVQGG